MPGSGSEAEKSRFRAVPNRSEAAKNVSQAVPSSLRPVPERVATGTERELSQLAAGGITSAGGNDFAAGWSGDMLRIGDNPRSVTPTGHRRHRKWGWTEMDLGPTVEPSAKAATRRLCSKPLHPILWKTKWRTTI